MRLSLGSVAGSVAVCGVLVMGAQSCGTGVHGSGVGISGAGGGAVVVPQVQIHAGKGWLVTRGALAAGVWAAAEGVQHDIMAAHAANVGNMRALAGGGDPCDGKPDDHLLARWVSNWRRGGVFERPWMDCGMFRRIRDIRTSGRAKWKSEVDAEGKVVWGKVDMSYTGYRPTPFQVVNCITRVLWNGEGSVVFDRVVWYLRTSGEVSSAAGWVKPVIAAVAVNGNGRIGAIYPSEWSEKGWRACAGE